MRYNLFASMIIAVMMTTLVKARDISGAGATFPYPIYAKWADLYKKATGNGVNYQAIGSGAGIKQIKAGTLSFAGTDAPLSPQDLEKSSLIQWPMIVGGIVPIVHGTGLTEPTLTLDGPTLADIFLGKITVWNDPHIIKLNPNIKLPATPIIVVHRADGSGTSFHLTSYLATVSPEWKAKVGAATSVNWPLGIGAKGNDGVANIVANVEGAIGYVEYAYARQNHLAWVNMKTKSGKTVQPSLETFQAAALNADWDHSPGFAVSLVNPAGDQSWPLTATSFILMPKAPKDKEAASAAQTFFAWCFANGDPAAKALDYVPMPKPLVKKIEATWQAYTQP